MLCLGDRPHWLNPWWEEGLGDTAARAGEEGARPLGAHVSVEGAANCARGGFAHLHPLRSLGGNPVSGCPLGEAFAAKCSLSALSPTAGPGNPTDSPELGREGVFRHGHLQVNSWDLVLPGTGCLPPTAPHGARTP